MSAEPRLMPDSPEAEEHVLSCCLLAGDEGKTLRRALEAGLTPESFYEPKNRVIFEVIQSLTPPAIETLVAELNSRNQFEEVGAWPHLLKITGTAPTTAHAGYFIDKVHELATKRQMIRRASAILEHAYNGTSIEELSAQARALAPAAPEKDLRSRLYSASTPVPKPEEIYTAAGTTICTPGNLTTIYSQAKAGKTALIGAMIAAAMDVPGSLNDTLGFRSSNPSGHALLHFDTEQSRYDWSRMITTACRRVGASSPPPWVLSYNLTGLSASDARKFMRQAITQATRKFKAIHSIFLDGVADFVASPNDDLECFPFITELHAQSIESNCPIISILHMNAGSENEKGRGHLGSQLERKSESNITMEKKEEVTIYWGTKQRGKALPKSSAPAFKWSDEQQYHVSCETSVSKSTAGRKKLHTIHEFMDVIPVTGQPPKTASQIHRYANDLKEVKLNTFKDLLGEAVKDGLLVRTYDEKIGFTYVRV